MKFLLKIYLLIFVSIVAAIIYLFISIGETQTVLNKNIEMLFVKQAEYFCENINNEIHEHIKEDIYSSLKNDPSLVHSLEDTMSVLLTNSYKYIYVLYRDKHGDYRYLLDGSKEDKGYFNQKLNIDKTEWNKVYETKQNHILNQEKLHTLWITYLRPVILKGKVEAVIAVDFSTQLPDNVSNAISPLNNTFIYIFLAIGMILLILFYQTIFNLKTKKDSITDTLTQVYNRNYLRDFLAHINMRHYQIIMLDIDHFKQVNDSYGHKAGDVVLSQTAKILKEELRNKDVLIRFGGEEFLIFVHRKNSTDFLAYNVAERLRYRLEKERFISDESEIFITISAGITCSPEHFKSTGDAIKYADEMLYIAKKEGRNQVIATENHKNDDLHFNEHKTIHEIKEAIDDDRIFCYFQPIYDLKTNTILKYEALVRMRDKNNKILTPVAFLDNILHTNVYKDMTKCVLAHVFKNIKEKKTTISTNLNFSDIVDNDIYALIIEQITNNQEFATSLIVELLENELIQSSELIKTRLDEIRSFGVKIAVDDFGSGYSNYVIFQTLPIDIVKIDGSIIKDLDTSKIAYKITKSIVHLTQELNIITVAEYVHSQEILELVQELGVSEAQGFHLGKPQEKI